MLKIEKRRTGQAGGDPADGPGSDPATGSGAATPQPPRLPARRNPKWIALGVIAICLGALLSYVIYDRVAAESAVLIMTKTVYRGTVITAGDLAPATVSGAVASDPIPADQVDELIGQTAIYDLIAGSVVPSGAIGELVVPPEGRAVVGIRLVEGRSPIGLLHPGSAIRLIAIPPEGAEPDFTDQYTGSAYPAKVVDASEGVDGMSVLVNVDVPADQAATVALLAARDRLAAVRDFDGER